MNQALNQDGGVAHGPRRRVAVLGAGIAGLSCARRLRERGHRVTLFDKSRGPSGRAATRRADGWSCDHGAQYFSARTPEFAQVVAQWCEAGVCQPWSPRLQVFGPAPRGSGQARAPQRYVGMPHMSALGHWLAEGLDLRLRHTVTELRGGAAGWSLHSDEHGWHGESFDSVLLALPPAQARALLQPVDPELGWRTEPDPMEPCWCVMAVYDADPLPEVDGAFVNQGPLSWVCADHRKPGRQGPCCWVLHAGPQWSRARIHAPPAEVGACMLEAFADLGARGTPRQVTVHRWLYARGTLDPAPGMIWHAKAGLGLAGDWLAGGRIEGAWRSGRALADALG
ncbi:NAD(P)/FAD-dependent oxidoreductase [Thiomonas sp.]|uniref:NAD(P)/FAD-dependent oxidoreductase n=1 Tax=Thiomonas sp. TaxID=2047785 RepID=UPI00262059FB|nr:FAD-dependent oxidoreductase [Thiomonas sp.]